MATATAVRGTLRENEQRGQQCHDLVHRELIADMSVDGVILLTTATSSSAVSSSSVAPFLPCNLHERCVFPMA